MAKPAIRCGLTGDGDDEVNGGDLVEWFGIWREQVKALLAENGVTNDQ